MGFIGASGRLLSNPTFKPDELLLSNPLLSNPITQVGGRCQKIQNVQNLQNSLTIQNIQIIRNIQKIQKIQKIQNCLELSEYFIQFGFLKSEISVSKVRPFRFTSAGFFLV